ncbi:MAG: hypothetical protein WCK01_01815 [Candidatus Uhrbacteria bacterium]
MENISTGGGKSHTPDHKMNAGMHNIADVYEQFTPEQRALMDKFSKTQDAAKRESSKIDATTTKDLKTNIENFEPTVTIRRDEHPEGMFPAATGPRPKPKKGFFKTMIGNIWGEEE